MINKTFHGKQQDVDNKARAIMVGLILSPLAPTV